VLFAEGSALGLTAGEAVRVALTLSGGGEFSFVLFKIAQDLWVLPDTLAKLLTISCCEVGDAVGNYIEAIDAVANRTVRVREVFSEAEAHFDESDADGLESLKIDERRDALLQLHFQDASIGRNIHRVRCQRRRHTLPKGGGGRERRGSPRGGAGRQHPRLLPVGGPPRTPAPTGVDSSVGAARGAGRRTARSSSPGLQQSPAGWWRSPWTPPALPG